MGDEMILPDNMTEEEVLNIVRDLMGDDMTDQDLRNAYNSGCFKEFCPDIVNYAAKRKLPAAADDSSDVKPTKSSEDPRPGPSKNKDEEKPKCHSKSSKHKDDADSESESIASAKHSHHKKKKKKHSKDHKRDKDHKKDRSREHDERKEKPKPTENKEVPKPKPQPPKVIELSDSEDERKQKEKQRKEKKKVIAISSSDESDREKYKKTKEQTKETLKDSKKDHSHIKDKTDSPKVHPFYQDKGNEPGVSQPSTKVPKEEPQGEKTVEKKKEPKPFTKYSTSVSKVNLRKWRPVLHRDHIKYQRKFRLKPVSVVCIDLLDFPMIFHPPRKHSKSPNAVPLTNGVSVSDTRLEMIRRLERDKSNWFKKKINKRALKFLRGGKNKRLSDSSDDDDRHHKRARIMDRIISTSDTNSDSSSVMVPHKKPKKDSDNHRGGKMSKAEKEADAKRRKIEEVKRRVDKFSTKGTRLLAWENKDAYFNNKKKDDLSKDRDKIIAEKRRRQEEMRQQRMENQKNAPTVSFQRILKQIETANKEQAEKPKVQLKIPKKNQNSNRPVPMSEYKLDGRIGVGDVYKEVTKLLSSNVLVECPVMAGPGDDLGEYTVKKISWWLLKNEKDPAERGAYHPECHDDDDMESVHSDDFDWPDNVSSINGCVSDPEGTAADIPPDPKKVQDPDWADDYCGEASLYARIRKETKDAAKNVGLDSVENMRSFLRTKPGTNYSKPNFEVKCFICNELLKGQRQFGAHIRSDSHKNNFRNYSLDMANYEENVEIPEPKKYYVAKLVEYSMNSSTGNTTTATSRSDESVETKHQVCKIERTRSDSPGPIVGGDAAPNIMVQEMPIPDDISLPSIQNYDISSDESLQNVRVAIRTTDRWNDDLERKWRTWKDEEAKIAEEYNAERDFFIMEPERHPNYQEEWLKYWDQKCTELENQGIDTENYNFHKDWMGVWLTRMQEIMMEKVEKRVAELKTRLGIDKHTLRERFGVSKEDTKRKTVKKKGRKTTNLGGSIKSSGKVYSSTANGPQLVQPAALQQQRNNNNVHNSKPECLPTPPVTDEDRNIRETQANAGRGSPPPSKEIKSDNRSKGDRHDKRHKHDDDDRRRDRRKDDHRRHRDKYYDGKHRRSRSRDRKHSNDKHDHRDRDKDRNEKRHRKDDKHSSRDDRRHRDDQNNHRDKKESKVKEEKVEKDNNLETVSPQSFDTVDSAQNANLKKETKSECSISSAEPPPPGEEPILGSSSKPGRPSAPVISDRFSSKVKEMNERIKTELKIKLETRNESSNSKPEPISHHSKLNENSNSNSNDPTSSKYVTSCSYNSSDETKDKPDSDKNSVLSSDSTNSNTRKLQKRLKELREALNQEDGKTSTDNSKRPKVIPLDRTNEVNLEDGEVGSDISDLDLNASKGVSTFVNKVIPGRAELEMAAASSSANSLSKNSIGYHLLERKKSVDESSSKSNDRSKHERRDGSKNHNDKDDRHDKSRGHSSKYDDRDRNKHNNRSGSKDDRRRWDNKDTRNYNSKGNRGHNDHGRGGNRNVSKRGGAHNQAYGNNKSHYTNNVVVTPSFTDDSWANEATWEPEASWEPVEQLPTPVPSFPPVPDNSSHIPVLDSSRPLQHHQPYQPQPQFHPQQNQWNNGSGWGAQGYPPQTGYNNY